MTRIQLMTQTASELAPIVMEMRRALPPEDDHSLQAYINGDKDARDEWRFYFSRECLALAFELWEQGGAEWESDWEGRA